MSSTTLTSIATLRKLLVDLIAGYQSCARTEPTPERVAPERSLSFAHALVRDVGSRLSNPNSLFQIAVIGPTQVGKSTIVNVLLGKPVAQASPLAGFTRHAFGFYVSDTSGASQHLHVDLNLDETLAGKRTDSRLPENHLDSYGLQTLCREELDTGVQAIPRCIVWDTPDFDSLTAQKYVNAMMNVCALADFLLVVVSKEKYADRSVWNTLQLLCPLQKPTLLVVNKMTQDAKPIILNALRDTLSKGHFTDHPIPIYTLPYLADTQADFAVLQEHAQAIIKQVYENPTILPVSQRLRGTQRLMQAHWDHWCGPLQTQHAALQQWIAQIERELQAVRSAYQRDFLDHPNRFDSLKRVMVELLYLLEIPGLATSMTKLRSILTWPARRLLSGKNLFQHTHQARHNNEEQIVKDLYHACLTRHMSQILANRDSTPDVAFWTALQRAFDKQRMELDRQFTALLSAHQDQLQIEIQTAANQLYQRLVEHPLLLNSLRAARVTADAAGVALAIKTAGVGVHDLLFAPAMMSLTSILTESAIGGYMQQVSADLKKKHLSNIEQKIFNPVLNVLLLEIAEHLQDDCIFQIDETRLQKAKLALESLNHA